MDYAQYLHIILILAAASIAFRTMANCKAWTVRLIIALQIIVSFYFALKISHFNFIVELIYLGTLVALLIYAFANLRNKLAIAVVLPVFIFNLFRINHWPFALQLSFVCFVSILAYIKLGFSREPRTITTGLLAITAADALIILFSGIQSSLLFDN